MGDALRHFVEQALGTRLEDFDDWFPEVFDWRAFCADVPEMVQRMSGDWVDADDAEISEGLRRRAQDHFRHAYLTTLAVLAASTPEDDDPGELFELLVAPPEDAEERRLQDLVHSHLGPAERATAGMAEEDPGGSDETTRALEDLFQACWDDVCDLLALGEVEYADDLTEEFDAMAVARPTLLAVARIGVLLAECRWLSTGRGPGLPEE